MKEVSWVLDMLGLHLGAGYTGGYSPINTHPNSPFIYDIHFFVWTLYFNNNHKTKLTTTNTAE